MLIPTLFRGRLVSLTIVSLAWLMLPMGCNKKAPEPEKKELSAQELCDAFLAKRNFGPFVEGAKKNKDVFMEECLKVPVSYVKCDVEGRMAECMDDTKKYQGTLNDLIVMGKKKAAVSKTAEDKTAEAPSAPDKIVKTAADQAKAAIDQAKGALATAKALTDTKGAALTPEAYEKLLLALESCKVSPEGYIESECEAKKKLTEARNAKTALTDLGGQPSRLWPKQQHIFRLI